MPFPYESYKQVFVEDAYIRVDSRASIATLSTHFLHGEDIIDQVRHGRQCCAFGLRVATSEPYRVRAQLTSVPDDGHAASDSAGRGVAVVRQLHRHRVLVRTESGRLHPG